MAYEDRIVACGLQEYHGEEERVLARLVVKHGFLGEEQILEALSLQHQERNLGNMVSLGDVLVQRGMLSPKQLDSLKKTGAFLILKLPDRAFARLVVRKGFASQDQIDRAMELQASLYKRDQSFKSLGDILVEQGVLSPQRRNAIVSALARAKKENNGNETTAGIKGESESVSHEQAACDEPAEIEESPEEHKESRTVVVRDKFFDLLVSQDKLGAYMRVKEPVLDEIHAAQIKSLLESQGIVFGLIADDLLEKHLRRQSNVNRLWQIARGRPPERGKDAEIRYHFDAHPAALLKSGLEGASLNETGRTIEVRQGDLVAEIVPASKSCDGTDVYGHTVSAEKPGDARFICGSGITLSDDGLKAYAKIDGNPQLSLFGKLSVLPELTVDGDVSFETGNISFEGHIHVRGVVQDGFRVKGASLRASEIAKAYVDVTGDVVVYGGILGATVKSQGTVKAVHVHASRIEALGDLIVERGIADSKVTVSGRCIAERGKIISCNVVSRQGIEAMQIGSDRSRPCSLAIGIDPLAEKEMEKLKEAISLKAKGKANYLELVAKVEAEATRVEQKIGELAQVQDQTLREKRALTAEYEKLVKLKDTNRLTQSEARLKELESFLMKSEEDMEKLFERQDQLREKASSCRDKIRELEKAIEVINHELAAVCNWSSRRANSPTISVSETIYSGTSVTSPLSLLELKENARRVLIRETKDHREGQGGSMLKMEGL